MTDPETPAEHHDTESQEERGEPGSRDEGYGPGDGPADRPMGTTGDDSSIDDDGSDDSGSHMPSA